MKVLNFIFLFIFIGFNIKSSYATNCKNINSAPSKLISENEMNQLIEDHKDQPGVKVKKVNISASHNWVIPNSSDEASVFFAIVGIIVIIAWIPYAIQFLADASQSEESYCPWYRLSLRRRSFSQTSWNSNGFDDFGKSIRNASLTGLKFDIGSLNKKYSVLGLSAELGTHSIKDKIQNSRKRFNGTYLLFGPSLNFGVPENTIFSLDFMGGFSTNNDVSLLGEASLNFHIPLSDSKAKYRPHLNLSVGAQLLDIRGDEGLLKYNDPFSTFLAFGFGVIL